MTDRGNVKIMTVMGDALMDGLSDAGSIPGCNRDIPPSSEGKGEKVR